MRAAKKTLGYAVFKACDFTAGSLAETIGEHSVFQDCVFDYVDFNNFSDKGNTFTNCRFYRGEWQVGAIGTDWNNSARGEYQSRYVNCHFENVKLTKTVFRDPHFVNCSFVFKKLSGVDFECSGFVGCRFEGAFQDLTFRGEYSNKETSARKGKPEFAGFADVDFEKAALQWFTIRGGFPFHAVKMPADGSACIVDLPRMCRDRQAILDMLPDPRSKEVAARYLKLCEVYAYGKAADIVSRYDLIESFEKGEEALAENVYDLLKRGYEISV